MSDNETPTTETADAPLETGESPEAVDQADTLDGEPDEATDDLGQLRKLRKENKSLRDRLHEADERATTAGERLDQMHRNEIARLASERLHDGSDILADRDLSDFLTDTGQVDPEAISAAVDALAGEKPHLAKPPAGRPPSETPVSALRSGTGYTGPSEGATWQAAFAGRNR